MVFQVFLGDHLVLIADRPFLVEKIWPVDVGFRFGVQLLFQHLNFALERVRLLDFRTPLINKRGLEVLNALAQMIAFFVNFGSLGLGRTHLLNYLRFPSL